MNEEIWKPAFGIESRYEVSSHGRMRSLFTLPKRIPLVVILKQTLGDNGYFHVRIRLKSGKSQKVYPHRIVAATFLTASDPSKNCVNHLDFNRTNNCVENVEWITRGDNVRYSAGHQRHCYGEQIKSSKLNAADVALLRRTQNQQEWNILAARRGVASKYAAEVARGRNWKYVVGTAG